MLNDAFAPEDDILRPKDGGFSRDFIPRHRGLDVFVRIVRDDMIDRRWHLGCLDSAVLRESTGGRRREAGG